MNRKQLTATQILHGARAYSHNASRRAHQLSGPKRVRAMHGPVGNAALNDGIDSSCQHCGFQLCNCGPCATCGEVPYYCSGTHAYEQAKPSARALDNLGAEPSPAGGRFKVGDRVRGRGCATGDWHEGTVLSIREDIGLTALLVASGAKPFVSTSSLEPAPSPVSEAPAVESEDDALMAVMCGWYETDPCSSKRRWAKNIAPVAGISRLIITLEEAGYVPYTLKGRMPVAPTLLQAACAALAIRIDRASCTDPRNSFTATGPDNRTMGVSAPDAESCARAALEAWSRREPAQ